MVETDDKGCVQGRGETGEVVGDVGEGFGGEGVGLEEVVYDGGEAVWCGI